VKGAVRAAATGPSGSLSRGAAAGACAPSRTLGSGGGRVGGAPRHCGPPGLQGPHDL